MESSHDPELDDIELVDFLHDILHPEIVKYNDVSYVSYFKQRLDNEPVTEDLMSEAIVILEGLLNSGDLEDQVNMEEPEDRPERRKNLNELVAICERIVGVNKSNLKNA